MNLRSIRLPSVFINTDIVSYQPTLAPGVAPTADV